MGWVTEVVGPNTLSAPDIGSGGVAHMLIIPSTNAHIYKEIRLLVEK